MFSVNQLQIYTKYYTEFVINVTLNKYINKPGKKTLINWSKRGFVTLYSFKRTFKNITNESISAFKNRLF